MTTEYAKAKAEDDTIRNLSKMKAHADESARRQNTVEQKNFQRMLHKMEIDKKLATGDIAKEQRVWVQKLDRLESEKRVIQQDRRYSYIKMFMAELDSELQDVTRSLQNDISVVQNDNDKDIVSPVTKMLRRSSLPKDSPSRLGLRRSSSSVTDFRRSGPLIPPGPKLFLSSRGSLDASSIKQLVNHSIQTPGRRRSSTRTVNEPPATTPYERRRRGSLPVRSTTVDCIPRPSSLGTGRRTSPSDAQNMDQLFPILDLDVKKQAESKRFEDIQRRIALFISKPLTEKPADVICADKEMEPEKKKKKKKRKGLKARKELFFDDTKLPDLVKRRRPRGHHVKFDLPDDDDVTDSDVEIKMGRQGSYARRLSTPF